MTFKAYSGISRIYFKTNDVSLLLCLKDPTGFCSSLIILEEQIIPFYKFEH